MPPPPHTAPTSRRRDRCRLCKGQTLQRVLDLPPTPPANAFVRPEQADEPQQTYPLDVWLCSDCGHVQLLEIVDPRILFENYVYVSGTSPVFVDHFRRYARDVAAMVGLDPGDLVIDIGSNDGTLLGQFAELGATVVGVDPARDIARRATEAGIETVAEFFTPGLAVTLRRQRGAARIVTANNVFAHADDLDAIVAGVLELLASDGVLVIEVSYLLDVYEKTLFDTIYHEHLSYHSVQPLERYFQEHGLELIDARRVDTHGGSLRVTAQRLGGPLGRQDSVSALIALERAAGLDRAETFHAWAKAIDRRKTELWSVFSGLQAEGQSIAGFGAPAKATTLMYHFGIGPDLIGFIVDDSPLKQGLLTPGLHIPVMGSSAIEQRAPDALLILAWNFADPIIAKHEAFATRGGQFIIPLPEVRVVR